MDMGDGVNINALNAVITCRCGAGKVADFIRRVEKQAIEREERQRREMRELMGERKVSRAKKVRGVWK